MATNAGEGFGNPRSGSGIDQFVDSSNINYYELLGVNFGASSEQISKAFRQQALRYHPDKTLDPRSEEMMKRLIDAKEVLLSEDRADYDEKLTDEGKTVDPTGFLLGGMLIVRLSY